VGLFGDNSAVTKGYQGHIVIVVGQEVSLIGKTYSSLFSGEFLVPNQM